MWRRKQDVPAWPRSADDAAEPIERASSRAYVAPPRRPRRRRVLGLMLGLLIGVLVGAAAAIAILAFAGPQPAPLPPTQGSGSVAVTVDDAFLTASLDNALHQVPLGTSIRGVTAHCVPGDRILLSADTQLGPFNQPGTFSMTLQPGASQGHFVVHVLSASIGGLTLPAAVDAQMEAAADAQLRSLGDTALAGSTQYVVRGAQTTYDHLTVMLGPAAG